MVSNCVVIGDCGGSVILVTDNKSGNFLRCIVGDEGWVQGGC